MVWGNGKPSRTAIKNPVLNLLMEHSIFCLSTIFEELFGNGSLNIAVVVFLSSDVIKSWDERHLSFRWQVHKPISIYSV